MTELKRRELPPTAGLPLLWRDFGAAFAGGRAGEFEQALASFLHVPQLDLFSSGTLCLAIAFETLKEATGRKRVILPAYTCPLVAIAAHHAGMEIVLCDTAKNSFELDNHALEQLCDESIAAVVPTDIAGLPADLTELAMIAKSAGAYVIEDAAQALGAQRAGRPLGRDADMTVFSLAVGKGLSLYDGGILVVKDGELRAQMRQIAARRIRKAPHVNLIRLIQLLGLHLLYNPYGLSYVYGDPLRSALAKGDLLGAVGDEFDFEIPAYEFDELRKRIGKSALLRLPGFVSENRIRANERADKIEVQSGLQVLRET
ncbi:MAG: aminotransferase class I/II-fold pyridoxal phosphate-dependent enzyme, partial [Candidatus Obscuribacterales bacterium]|nr:aminotransferase class I/II-fold pyridoxal phosphate-dependent enzyme [Candidatus Obscuribacterales bacterium]